MIKIAKFDKEDYETFKDEVNSIKNSLGQNGEFYAFEYEGVQGYVYIFDVVFNIFFCGRDGLLTYVPVVYDSENDVVFLLKDEDVSYHDDGVELKYEDGVTHYLFCSCTDFGNTVNYLQYNTETKENLLFSYVYYITNDKDYITNDKVQYLFWNDQKEPSSIMLWKDSKNILGKKNVPKIVSYSVEDSICYPVKYTKHGVIYSLNPFKYKSLPEMKRKLSQGGFNTAVPEKLVELFNFRFSGFDYLSFARELKPAIEAESSYTFKLGDGDSDNNVN